MTPEPRPHSVSGIFPSLDALVHLLPGLHGADRRALVDLPAAIHGGRVDADAGLGALAARILTASRGRVEPRNIMGYWDIASHYGLLVEDERHELQLGPRGAELVARPAGRVFALVAAREGLHHLVTEVGRGAATLAELLPGWRAVLAGNRRFAAAASHPRSLGQRVASLVTDGWLVAHGDHATRLADEAGFRGREVEPAFAELGGGLGLSDRGRACATITGSTRFPAGGS